MRRLADLGYDETSFAADLPTKWSRALVVGEWGTVYEVAIKATDALDGRSALS